MHRHPSVPGALRTGVIKHVCTVMVLAVAIAERCQADVELVKAGRATARYRPDQDPRYAARRGGRDHRPFPVPSGTTRLIIQEAHRGRNDLPEEAARMGLPDLDYLPSTLEEKIVCHADNLVGDAELPDLPGLLPGLR